MGDFDKFTQPKIQYNELVLPANATLQMDQEAYKLSKRMLVDYVWVGTETLSVNGAAPAGAAARGMHQLSIQFPNLWWWITERRESAQRMRLGVQYLNYAESRQWSFTNVIIAAPIANIVAPANFAWKFLRPWRYVPGCGMIADWEYRLGQFNPAADNVNIAAIDVVLYGVGVYSRHRRIFEFQMPAINSIAGPLRGQFTEAEFCMNQTNEPYDIDEIQFRIQGTNVRDFRCFNMLYVTLRPTIGEPFSEVAVPMAAYGVDSGPIRSTIYQPTGGPLLLEPGTALGWEINNLSGAWNVRTQVALIGRVEPTGF